MSFPIKRTVYPLLVPAVFLSLSTLIVWQWPGLVRHLREVRELRPFLLILPFLPYVLFTIGVILGWRLNNGGLILSFVILGLAYFSLSDAAYRSQGCPMSEAVRILLPWNLGLFTTLTRRRLLTPVGLSCVGVVVLQIYLFLLLFQTIDFPLSRLIPEVTMFYRFLADYSMRFESWLHQVTYWGSTNVSALALLSMATASIFLAFRFALSHDVLSAGFLGSLIAAFLGLSGSRTAPSDMVYFSAAGLILLVSAVDVSFSMAYLDELTSLPARRSLNNELLNLGRKYVIAMIDIDHFKKFNDRYGHKTGDHVLKMIASKLKEITGGAKVFRYGGEEFTAIFPGKSLNEAMPHLEVCRKIIESTPFVIRGNERRVRSTDNKRKILLNRQEKVKITVSIGGAAPGKDFTTPENVLKEADRILYKAKQAGRNRVATRWSTRMSYYAPKESPPDSFE